MRCCVQAEAPGATTSEKALLFSMQVNISPDAPPVQLDVHEGAVPADVARAFVALHRLKADSVQIITQVRQPTPVNQRQHII